MPECRTPRQIRLANAFCRYRGLATEIALPPCIMGARKIIPSEKDFRYEHDQRRRPPDTK